VRLFIRRHIITQLAEEETAERRAHGERELVAYKLQQWFLSMYIIV
jgi:hypothetical protein